MKKAIAIAIAKERNNDSKECSSPPEQPREIEEELSRLGLGTLILISICLGLLGLITLFFGLISEAGPLRYLLHWVGITFSG